MTLGPRHAASALKPTLGCGFCCAVGRVVWGTPWVRLIANRPFASAFFNGADDAGRPTAEKCRHSPGRLQMQRTLMFSHVDAPAAKANTFHLEAHALFEGALAAGL